MVTPDEVEHIRQRYEVYEVDALLYSQALQLFDVRLQCAREKKERQKLDEEKEKKDEKIEQNKETLVSDKKEDLLSKQKLSEENLID